jgi:hypothetical protein
MAKTNRPMDLGKTKLLISNKVTPLFQTTEFQRRLRGLARLVESSAVGNLDSMVEYGKI